MGRWPVDVLWIARTQASPRPVENLWSSVVRNHAARSWMGGFIFSHTVRCLWSVSFLPQVPSFINLLTSECQSTRGNVDVGRRPVAPICVVLVIYFVCVLVSPYQNGQNNALASEFRRFTGCPWRLITPSEFAAFVKHTMTLRQYRSWRGIQ